MKFIIGKLMDWIFPARVRSRKVYFLHRQRSRLFFENTADRLNIENDEYAISAKNVVYESERDHVDALLASQDRNYRKVPV